jgi:hypothetical protein
VRPTPIGKIFFDRDSGCYGFEFHFSGGHVHHCIDTFESIEHALNWADPHRERIWSEASDADESAVLISTAYVPGSVAAGCR